MLPDDFYPEGVKWNDLLKGTIVLDTFTEIGAGRITLTDLNGSKQIAIVNAHQLRDIAKHLTLIADKLELEYPDKD